MGNMEKYSEIFKNIFDVDDSELNEKIQFQRCR